MSGHPGPSGEAGDDPAADPAGLRSALRRDAGIGQRTGLRRADWRFLLPGTSSTIQHLVLLGGPPDLADRLLEGRIAGRVSVTLPGERTADAAAVLEGAPARLREVAACLKPGGALYYEINRRALAHLADTPARVQHAMQRAGLFPTGAYWAAPNFAGCRRYIPLEFPEAFHWYLSTLFVSGAPIARLLEAGVRLYTGMHRGRFASIAPCYAVTGIAGGPDSPGMPSVLGHPAFPSELRQPGMRPVVLTSGQDDGSRVVLLPFLPGRRPPAAAVKVATQADFNRNTEREQTVLAEIRSRLVGDIRRTIPLPLGQLRFGELSVGIESCASGSPLVVTSGRWPASFAQQTADLRLAVRWLCEFHRQVHAPRMLWGEPAIERWIESPLAAYARTFGLTPGEKQLFAAVRAWSRSLAGASLPVLWTHYDFGPWNLYRDEHDFMVIDWEFGRDWERDRFGPALYDLLYFVTYWNHVVRHLHDESAEVEGLCRLFLRRAGADRYSRATHQAIAEYMALFDIDRRFLPLMLVYLWVEQALHQFDRKRSLGQGQVDRRAGNRSTRYLAALARHAGQLFSE
jgi:hypothetical protein